MILVTGVSRSGKTSTLSLLVSQNKQWRHITASRILREIDRPLDDLDPGTALQNQRALVAELERRGLLKATNTLLDGHAVIEGRAKPLPLPDIMFDALSPSGIVVIHDDVRQIFNRRALVGRPRMSISDIKSFQSEEIELSKAQAIRLGVPFLKLQSGDTDQFSQWLCQFKRDREA